MYGTEKQICYAHDIIINAQTHIDGIIEHYKKLNETATGKWIDMNRDVISAAEDMKKILDKYFLEVEDAYKWIKNRELFSIPRLNIEMNRRIQRYCKKRGGMELIELDIDYRP